MVIEYRWRCLLVLFVDVEAEHEMRRWQFFLQSRAKHRRGLLLRALSARPASTYCNTLLLMHPRYLSWVVVRTEQRKILLTISTRKNPVVRGRSVSNNKLPTTVSVLWLAESFFMCRAAKLPFQSVKLPAFDQCNGTRKVNIKVNRC